MIAKFIYESFGIFKPKSDIEIINILIEKFGETTSLIFEREFHDEALKIGPQYNIKVDKEIINGNYTISGKTENIFNFLKELLHTKDNLFVANIIWYLNGSLYESSNNVLKPKSDDDIRKELKTLFKNAPKEWGVFRKILKTKLIDDSNYYYETILSLNSDHEWDLIFYRYFYGTKRYGLDTIFSLDAVKKNIKNKQKLPFVSYERSFYNVIHNLDELVKEADDIIKDYNENKIIKEYKKNKGSHIFESNINNIKETDVLTKDYMDRYVKGDNYTVELFMWEYADENGLDPEEMDVDEWLSTEEVDKWIDDEMESRIYDAIHMFNYGIIEDGKVKIWRKITVSDDWLEHLEKQGKRLGIYWSWDMEAADTHWGYDNTKNVATIESSIDENNVDWINTLRANAHPSSEDEKEVTLFKNTTVNIDRLWINDKEIDISILKNKTFKA